MTQENPSGGGDIWEKCSESAVFLFHEGECYGPYRIHNLSIGGVVLSGRHIPVKRKDLQVMLLRPGRLQAHATGQVIYQEPIGSREFLSAVAFQEGTFEAGELSPDFLQNLPDEQEQSDDPIILVVDDSPEICRALERDLRSLGRKSVTFEEALDAVMLALDPNVRIEAAVVDLFLGKSDGLELLAFLARRRPDVRRVLISGQVRLHQLELAHSSGRAHAVMKKPWNRNELAQALDI